MDGRGRYPKMASYYLAARNPFLIVVFLLGERSQVIQATAPSGLCVGGRGMRRHQSGGGIKRSHPPLLLSTREIASSVVGRYIISHRLQGDAIFAIEEVPFALASSHSRIFDHARRSAREKHY